MKNLYKSFLVLSLILCVCIPGTGQVLNENFNAGLPATWTQSPSATWSLSPNLGVSGSACIFTEDLTITSPTNSLRSSTVNLSSVTNLTVSFKVALVGNNFIVPDLALLYNNGTGPQFLARWGSGFSANTTYTLATFDYDYQPPLDSQNVHFFNCTHTISTITGTAVSFIFDAEPFNGGYVVLDDILIKGKTISTTGLTENAHYEAVLVFPNPSRTKKVNIESAEIKTLLIIDQQGKSIPVSYKRINETLVEVDLTNFANGIYYLNATTDKNKQILKKVLLE